MYDTMGNEGINLLTGVLQSRMSAVSQKPDVVDIGEIGEDMSLNLNHFQQPIPQSDYLVCRQLTLGPTNNILAKTQDMGSPHSGAHIHNTITLSCPVHGAGVSGTVGEETSAAPEPPIPSARTAGGDSQDGVHEHHVLIPEKMRQLKPGDRVLVVWAGDDPVVIDIIYPATEIK